MVHKLVAQAFIHNPDNKQFVDHINHNKLDNCLQNLRWCTLSENQHNKSLHKNNTSGHPGVYWSKQRNKWRVQIRLNGKLIHCGLYNDIDIAVSVRRAKEQEYFGDFAPIH